MSTRILLQQLHLNTYVYTIWNEPSVKKKILDIQDLPSFNEDG